MSNTEVFTVTPTWAKVQLGGVDATDMTLALEGRSDTVIQLQRRVNTDTPAATESGHMAIRGIDDYKKFALAADEVCWCKYIGSPTGSAAIGVIET